MYERTGKHGKIIFGNLWGAGSKAKTRFRAYKTGYFILIIRASTDVTLQMRNLFPIWILWLMNEWSMIFKNLRFDLILSQTPYPHHDFLPTSGLHPLFPFISLVSLLFHFSLTFSNQILTLAPTLPNRTLSSFPIMLIKEVSFSQLKVKVNRVVKIEWRPYILWNDK